jgi:hypothetical protein
MTLRCRLRGPAGSCMEVLQGLETLVNTGDPWPGPAGAWLRVRRMQAKLHRWAVADPDRRFNDLFNLVCDQDFLTVAWERVRGNKGARTAGADRVIPAFISDEADVAAFLLGITGSSREGCGLTACGRCRAPSAGGARLQPSLPYGVITAGSERRS